MACSWHLCQFSKEKTSIGKQGNFDLIESTEIQNVNIGLEINDLIMEVLLQRTINTLKPDFKQKFSQKTNCNWPNFRMFSSGKKQAVILKDSPF